MLQECVSGDAAIGQSCGEVTLPTFRGEDPERNPLPAGSCVSLAISERQRFVLPRTRFPQVVTDAEIRGIERFLGFLLESFFNNKQNKDELKRLIKLSNSQLFLSCREVPMASGPKCFKVPF